MLNARKERFAMEYLKDANGTQAAIRAGYSVRSAATTGGLLLRDPDVQALIAQERAKLTARVGDDRERIIQELRHIAYFDPRELYDAQGKARPLHELPEHVARAVESVSVHTGRKGSRTTLRVHNKLAGLRLLGEIFGLTKAPGSGNTTVEVGVQVAVGVLDPKTMSFAELQAERRKLVEGG